MAKKLVEPTFKCDPVYNWLVFGLPGSGKTTLCVAAAELAGWHRTLWIHTERPIRQFEVPYYSKDNPYGVLNAQFETLENLTTLFDKARTAAQEGSWLYDLVIIDGLSESELVNFNEAEEEVKKQAVAKGRQYEPRKAWLEQQGDILSFLWATGAGARHPAPVGLGAHVLATARVREFEDPTMPKDEKGQPVMLLQPALRGWGGMNIGHYYDYVLYAEERPGDDYRVYFKSKGRIRLKNILKHAGVPDFVRLPNLSESKNAFEAMADSLKVVL